MLLTNGCSFTEGYGLPNLTLAWPFCLGNMLNRNTVNLAVGGASNDRIFRTTIQYIHSETKIDYLIVGWTGLSRSEIPLHNGSYLKIKLDNQDWYDDLSLKSNPPKNYVKNFTTDFFRWHYNEFVWVKNLLCNIITLQTVCEKKNIKLKQFFAFDSTVVKLKQNHTALLELCENSYEFFKMEKLPFPKYDERDRNVQLIRDLINQIDQTSWIGDLTTTMRDYCQNFPFDLSGHPMEQGHQHWAEKVYETLCQR